MTAKIAFHDSLYRLSQVGEGMGVCLVRLLSVSQHNRYTARAVEFASGGATQFASDETITVTNLAEPADQDGQVPADTEAVALDVEGRWVVFVRQGGSGQSSMFPAKVVAAISGAAYSVREQSCTGAGTFGDKSGTSNVTAYNLAELSLGPGAAVAVGVIVLATAITDTGSTTRYVFDHPAYAKYLD
ncbi:MAG: hypothetical protein WC869_05170 [Phycisphaerae bacterium]|jgi:hypothetical protein